MRRSISWVVLLALVILVGGAVAALGQDGGFEYVGAKKCKKCHLKQYKSWEKTKMAQTWTQLEPGVSAEAKTAAGLDPETDYTKDESCVSCHVTGHGEPGGFVDIASTPELANVGCESCHGPGGTYIQDGYMTLDNKEYLKAEIVAVGMVDEVGPVQCTACHNADSPFVPDDFDFDFETSRDQGTHEHFPLKYEH